MGIDAAEQFDQAHGRLGRIVFPGNERPLEKDLSASDGTILTAGIDQHRQRPALARRHEGRALRLGRTVQANCQTIRLRLRRKPENGRYDAHGADRNPRRPDAGSSPIRDRFQCRDHRVVVVERLAHAHEHHVAKAFFGIDGFQNPAYVKHLCDDFPWPQMPDEAHLPGRTEDTTHRATRLRANTNRVPARVGHQHGLDRLAIAQAQQELPGEAVGAVNFIHDLGSIEEKSLSLPDGIRDPALERRQEIARC